jgi:mono/diheme cytochrome c family protein
MSCSPRASRLILACLPVLVLGISGVRAADRPVPPTHAANMAASQRLFAEQVRPWLEKNCLECHGGAKVRSGFNLTTREHLLKGGDKVVAVLPGRGADSPLVKYIRHAAEPHMPPKKPAAPPDVVAAVSRWIDLGAAYDRPLTQTAGAGGKKPLTVTDKDRQYWAYRPLTAITAPAVKDGRWPRGTIDSFLLAKMEARGVTPAPDAGRRTLVRRVYFDLVGLPPEPADVEALVHAADFEAGYEALVDRLLASPQFGERWARHWLDPARFAESHGFEHDYPRPHAYHYRDFVIRAFNADMPYDQFVRWQIAGDELAPDDPLALAATGFLGAGVFPTQITTSEAERIRYDAMDDMLATTGHTMLALTVGCARCHDHKFDPIPTRDYYQMLSTFTTTVRSEVDLPNKVKMQVCTEGLKPMRHHTADGSIPDFYPQTYFLKRGDVAQKDGVAPQAFLQVLNRHPDGASHWITPRPAGARTSFRRAGLAKWMTDSEYGAGALAARVIVNRLWHHHMGRGIVATVNDFGLQGEQPTHPELLEWLASDLVVNGWKLKRLHKMIVMSHVYRLSGDVGQVSNLPDQPKSDPDNRLWWHRPRRRLEAEAIRDNLLAVGGLLDQRMFGPGTLDEGMRRRSIYFTVQRSRLIPMLQVFDWPDTLTSAGARPTTVVAPQALLFLNNAHVRACAGGLAARLKPVAAKGLPDAVDLAYRLAFARPPSAQEKEAGASFLATRATGQGGLDRALADYALVLLSLNEFIYVD